MRKSIALLSCLAAALGFAAAARALPSSEATLRNLQAAFNGESNAANRYAAFALKADEEGHAQVARLFRAAAKAEQIHRDRHQAAIKELGGQPAAATIEEVKPGTTAENLRAAISGESYERDTMYPGFIAEAKAADARVAVRSLQGALEAEKEHARLYQQALDQLGANPAADYYVCPTCGRTVAAKPGKQCPVCREEPEKFLLIR